MKKFWFVAQKILDIKDSFLNSDIRVILETSVKNGCDVSMVGYA